MNTKTTITMNFLPLGDKVCFVIRYSFDDKNDAFLEFKQPPILNDVLVYEKLASHIECPTYGTSSERFE